jgi:histidyl-tRNA synthetase
MSNTNQALKGMKDILPAQTPLWQAVERAIQHVMKRYMYQEIRFPIVESTALFKRSIGDVTDIVSKEMYTFLDYDESVSLRPEGTAGCVRAGLQHGLFYNQHPKLWYMGPFFRHENPQLGRTRQFTQWGVECIGIQGALAEAEILSLFYDMLVQFKLQHIVQLEINSLGSVATQRVYKIALLDYFKSRKSDFTELQYAKALANPLRLLDSKTASLQGIIQEAPLVQDYFDSESYAHNNTLCNHLEALTIPYTCNPRLVRGLDYYEHTVFEWVTSALGAQGTVCAGGRYNALIGLLAATPTKPYFAAGFAMGLERFIALLLQGANVPPPLTPHLYVVYDDTSLDVTALRLAQLIRHQCPSVHLYNPLQAGNLKSLLKKAHECGAHFALLILKDRYPTVILKDLHTDTPWQQEFLTDDLLPTLVEFVQQGKL